MKLSFLSTLSTLVGAADIAFAEDGSSVLIGAKSSLPNLQASYYSIYGSIVNSGSPNARALDIYQDSCDPGTNINLWHQTGNDNQKWIYHPNTGVIESVACPGMVLDIEGGVGSGCAPETNIIMWYDTGAAWQQWMYSPDGKIISMYCDDMVLDISNRNDADGANIQLFRDIGSMAWNQEWEFQSSDDANDIVVNDSEVDGSEVYDTEAIESVKTTSPGLRASYYSIYGSIVNSGAGRNARALDIYQGSCEPGANINLWHQTGNNNQKWIYHPNTGVIESVACPGMVLDIEGGVGSGCALETNIILWYDTGAAWQQWWYSPDGKFTSEYCRGMVIDIYNGNNADGANIQLFGDTGSSGWNQVWEFQSSTEMDDA